MQYIPLYQIDQQHAQTWETKKTLPNYQTSALFCLSNRAVMSSFRTSKILLTNVKHSMLTVVQLMPITHMTKRDQNDLEWLITLETIEILIYLNLISGSHSKNFNRQPFLNIVATYSTQYVILITYNLAYNRLIYWLKSKSTIRSHNIL